MSMYSNIADHAKNIVIAKRKIWSRALPVSVRRLITEMQSQAYFPTSPVVFSQCGLAGKDEIGPWGTFQRQVLAAIEGGELKNLLDDRNVRCLIHTTLQELGRKNFTAILSLPDNAKCALLDLAREFPIWGMVPFFDYPSASVVSIQHSYHFMQIYKHTGILPEDVHSAVDFGDGYGRFACALARMGVDKITVVDLPLMQLLQKQYAVDVSKFSDFRNVDLNERITWVGEVDEIPQIDGECTDLFTAFWSLSETPLHVRDKVIPRLPEFKTICIVFQDIFANQIDNKAYFSKVGDRLSSSHEVSMFPCEHYPNNTYLIARRR